MRILFVAACALSALGAGLAAAPAQARLVGPGYDKSWGKAGVSLEEYRADAVACGREAAATDLKDSGPAEALILASRMLENPQDIYAATEAMKIAALSHNIPKAGDILEARLEQCLTGRGYREFKLTAQQRHHLHKLPIGSDERHIYLHSLASNPAVLQRQEIEEKE